jgi:3-phosphoshikimate 1-carboxyvinyltransferase
VKLVGDVISRPYIDMTLSLMKDFGVFTYWEGNDIVFDENKHYQSAEFNVENDWSASSYWFQIQSLLRDSSITLKGLFEKSTQGDSAIARLFEDFGVTVDCCGDNMVLKADNSAVKEKIKMDLLENPDLAQTIVVTACLLDVPFHITGLQTLKIKETDRIEALRTQLLKMGYVLDVGEDFSLSWDGTKCAPESPIRINTFDDHRMAMAFAPAAVKYPGIIINDVEVVSKSYPQYWEHLESAGFRLEVVE